MNHDHNVELLNIVFHGGTFGNFLKFFLDKFSKRTPEISGEPFSKIGTSHDLGNEAYSGQIQKYHPPPFIETNRDQSNLPVCIITPSTKKHFLYLKEAQWYRPYDREISCDDLWKNAFGEMPEFLREYAIEIHKLYNIGGEHFVWIPKFVVRDWYKLEFLKELEDTHNYKLFEAFKDNEFFHKQKLFELDLETFFDWKTFIKNIRDLDHFFDLELDHDRQAEMKSLFDKGLELDGIRKECNLAVSVLEHQVDVPLHDLNVSTEGFLYAEMEKRNNFIQMPLTNRFFRDTGEMEQFIEHYPDHYKAMNPNMPKFNGIPNPYYLKKDK